MRSAWQNLFQLDSKKIYILSLLIGLGSGLMAVLFYYLLSLATHWTYGYLLHIPFLHATGETIFFPQLPIGTPRRWLFFILPTAGGLLVGLFTFFLAPEVKGTGTDAFLEAFHNRRGLVRKRISIVKGLATLITLGSGGSAGKEGPMAQMGASLGGLMGWWFKAGERARRTFLLAGVAGGLGAIFKAPLGAALTAVEIPYKEDLESDALIPCLLSSIMAYTIFGSFLGFGHIFQMKQEMFREPTLLIFYALLGLVCAAVGYIYVSFFHGIKKYFFDRLKLPLYLIPTLGGLLTGCVGYFFPEVTGGSLGMIQQAINGKVTLALWPGLGIFGLFALMQILATSFTVSSGGSGGVFGPSLFIGGMLGGAVGTIAHHFFPALAPNVAPFVVVGMGAFFAGVANAPFASLIMVSEMTGGYELLPPLMLVAAMAFIFTRRWSIYKNQVINKFYSKAHDWEINPNLLKKIPIETAFGNRFHREAIIPRHTPMTQIRALATSLHTPYLMVENESGELRGVISLHDLGMTAELDEASSLIVAEDILTQNVGRVTVNDNLYTALEKLASMEYDKVAVIDPKEQKNKLLGYLREKDILRFYQKHYQGTQKPPARS